MANPSIIAAEFDHNRTKTIGALAGPLLEEQILREMSIADSVHDFNTQFYDRLPKNNSITTYNNNVNLLSTINFTYACQLIFPGNTAVDIAKRLFAEENNKVQAGQLGVLPAFYTKSSSAVKDNIEKYYLKKAIQLAFGLASYPKLDGTDGEGAGGIGAGGYTFIPRAFGAFDLTAQETYDGLVGALQKSAQFEEPHGLKYIPLVVDVQKRLTNVLREMGTTYRVSIHNPEVPGDVMDVKLAYCLNREMTNDAAGKLNFREPLKIARINYFVDIDEREVRYREVDGIIIGTGSPISFSRLQNINFPGLADVPPVEAVVAAGVPVGKQSQALSPWCTISLLPIPDPMGLQTSLGNFLSILNDSAGNSKTNVRANVHRNARGRLQQLVNLQNANGVLRDAVNNYLTTQAQFTGHYKSNIVEDILNAKNGIGVLQSISLEIYIWFLRKRLGDQLQALSCKKCRKYTRVSYDATNRLIHNGSAGVIHNGSAGDVPFQQDKESVFYSYDANACAFAILNKIPCIYEDAAKNLHVFVPQHVPGCPAAAANPGMIIGGGKFNDKNNVNQSGGVRWKLMSNDQYLINAILAKPETIINIAGRIFSLLAGYDARQQTWTWLYQYCQNIKDNFTTYTFNRTQEQMTGGGPGGEIINVFYLSPNVSGIPAEQSAREYDVEHQNSPKCVIVNILIPLPPDGSLGHFIVSYDFRTEAFEIKGPTVHQRKTPETISIPQIQGNLTGVLTLQQPSLGFTIFELVNSQFEPELQAGDRMDQDIFASIFEGYINMHNGGGKKDSELVGEKLTTDGKIESTYLLDFITMSLKNKKISSTTDKAFYFFNRFLFLKLLYTYEFQLIFDEERYEIDYNTSVLPNIAENQELYCLLEISKAFNDKINFIELLIYLNMLRGNSLDPTDFVVNVLVNLAEIYDFTLETTNYKLLELLALNEKLEISTDKEKIFKQILEESKTLFENEKNDRLFDAFYFNNLYNEECNEFLKKHGKEPSKIEEASEMSKKLLQKAEGTLGFGTSNPITKKPSYTTRIQSLPVNWKPRIRHTLGTGVARVAGGSIKRKKKTRRKTGRTTRKKRKSIKKKRKSTRRKRRSSRKKNKLSRKKK